MTTNLVERALRLAVKAHTGQVRKSDGSPYIVHPVMCGFMLKEHHFSDDVVAAALVHDVVEDCGVTLDTLHMELGETVADIVATVSEDTSLAWEERKVAYIERVRIGSEGAKAVSLADKIHNMESLLEALKAQGPSLWEKFNRGRDKKLWFEKEMLSAFEAGWNHSLVDRYRTLVSTLEHEY